MIMTEPIPMNPAAMRMVRTPKIAIKGVFDRRLRIIPTIPAITASPPNESKQMNI